MNVEITFVDEEKHLFEGRLDYCEESGMFLIYSDDTGEITAYVPKEYVTIARVL